MDKKLLPLSDVALIAKFQQGDYAAFEELVQRHEKKVYNLAYRIMGNMEDASDILQETFLQAFRKLGGFKGDSEFSTWLYRVAVNFCLMRKRKEKPTVNLEDPGLISRKDGRVDSGDMDWSDSPLASMENAELKKVLAEAIQQLPVEYRTVFALKTEKALTNEAIAKIVKLSLPAVKSRLHRARLFLQEKLTEYFSPSPENRGKETVKQV